MKPLAAIIAFCLGCLAAVAMGATPNFAMRGNVSPQFIAQAEQHAEHCRKTLALEWLGYELPQWSVPCRVELVPAGGAGGATFFGFDANGKGFDFEGKWQGGEQGILQDVIPHEVLHTVLASHIGRVPRWADEGAAMNAETKAGTVNFEEALHSRLTDQSVGGFTIDQLFRFAEYPKDLAMFYGQSHSVVKFLIQHNGKRGFVVFLEDAIRGNDYTPALTQHFGLTESTLQAKWLEWYAAGQPKSPDQLGIRSVSYQGPCRYIWNGSGWVQACDQQQYQPQVRPAQPQQPAQPPLASIPPKPCSCDNAALLARIEKLEQSNKQLHVELIAVKSVQPLKGDKGETGETGPVGPSPKIEDIVAEVVKQIPPPKIDIDDLASKLPPIRVRQIDRNGNVVVAENGEREEMNVRLGENLNLRYRNVDDAQLSALEERVRGLESE